MSTKRANKKAETRAGSQDPKLNRRAAARQRQAHMLLGQEDGRERRARAARAPGIKITRPGRRFICFTQVLIIRASRATMAHILWTCAVTPDPTDVLPPHLARAVGKEDLASQRGAVQFAMEALQRQQS
ncbi:hypothetical protein HPB48_020571 [Haemaphysalis longicornis]|uniref:Uncharacterized protein n=1 Tax=Haemaphysalis longicornis TaxID=44386 RepID=A0A9J6G5B9_HAELO|nr:hypothetical protein HPB48_020571 [Haemaphysalis longicornis]